MYQEAGIEDYFKDINRYFLLSRQEERDLIERMRRGDEEARDRLIGSNLRLVVSVARRYVGRGLPLMDLIEEGNMGLIKAASRFKLDVGCRFSTYATCWINQAIRRALVNTAKPVKIPSYLAPKIARWKKKAKRLSIEQNRSLTLRELAMELKIPPESYGVFHSAMSTSNSIRQTVSLNGANDESLVDSLENKKQSSPVAECIIHDEIARLSRLLDDLQERDARILRMRYGIGGQEPMTLQEIGDRVNLSRERVRQIESKALKNLNQMFSYPVGLS
jgi:RNA polymerase primary sigma factor